MIYYLKATHLFTQDDGFIIVIGFADDAFDPNQYVLLQKAHNYDDQDKQMGMDKLHIQVEDESRSHYGGVEVISMQEGAIKISLSDKAKVALALDGDIEIHSPVTHATYSDVKKQLRGICEAENIAFFG